MAQLMPLPLTVSCFSKTRLVFIFLVPAHPGSPGKRAVKWVCVCAACLQCFDTTGWASGRASGLYKLSDEVLVWLSVWSEVQIIAYGPADATAIPKTHQLLPHLNPDWFYLSGTGLPRLSWKKGRKTGVVVVVVVVTSSYTDRTRRSLGHDEEVKNEATATEN